MNLGQPVPATDRPLRLLLVDDEPAVLDAVSRILRPQRHHLAIHTATSGAEALDLLARLAQAGTPVDAVVSDLWMPGMDGDRLLREVARRHPETVRIILSGVTDRSELRRTIGPSHLFLAKPCDPLAIRAMVARACALRDLLNSPALQRLALGLADLPALPEIHQRILSVLGDQDAPLAQVGRLVAEDPALTAKVLQVVNSARFGQPRGLTAPEEACVLLGSEVIQALVLANQVFASYGPGAATAGFDVHALWHHSGAMAAAAAAIAQEEGQGPLVVDAAFAGGLLHDCGRLVLAAQLPREYAVVLAQVVAGETDLVAAETAAFGAAHPAVGACLLGVWGLPDSLVEAVAFHHAPATHHGGTFSALVALHGAETLLNAHAQGPSPGVEDATLDYLAELRLIDRIPRWREVVGWPVGSGPGEPGG